jgi:hypothetical protein
MKIKETKTHFIAICTQDNEGGTIMKVGTSMGKISKATGGFAGATACLVELNIAFSKFHEIQASKKESLIEKVIEQMRVDIAEGDVSAIAEMLTRLDKKVLKAFLPEGK